MSFLINPFAHGGGAPPAGGGNLGEDTFGYSGATEEITIQSGVSTIEFKMWGGAGSGGKFSASGIYGGGGGFTTGKIDVDPGDVVRIQVAQGGRAPPNSGSGGAGGWPDGGGGANGDADTGGGGGSCRLWINGTLIAVAGGGGGGGGWNGGGNAGAGGGSSGQDCPSAGGGSGGTQSAGGYDKSVGAGSSGDKLGLNLTDETSRTGGWGSHPGSLTSSTSDDGGGGGGGWYGGGGGGGDGISGGGGSGYLHTDCYDDATYTGSAQNLHATGSGDADYPGGTIGIGSQCTTSYNANPGGDGYVWLNLT